MIFLSLSAAVESFVVFVLALEDLNLVSLREGCVCVLSAACPLRTGRCKPDESKMVWLPGGRLEILKTV